MLCKCPVKAVEMALVARVPSSTFCFSFMHCRQDHCKPSHAVNESRYGGPTPPYIPNHKLVVPEPVKSLPVGERAWVGTALQRDPSNLHRGSSLGAGAPPPQDGPAHRRGLSFSATGEPKEEGLEVQISRLAELIGRLESKVGPPHPGLTFLPALSTLEFAGKLRRPGGLLVVRIRLGSWSWRWEGRQQRVTQAQSNPGGLCYGCFQERWLQDQRRKAGANGSPGTVVQGRFQTGNC